MAIETPKKKAAAQTGQMKVNPEIDAKLNTFMKEEPGLVEFVKNLPREQLERKFLLRKMQDQEQQQNYTVKVKEWLAKPEQADLVQDIKRFISPNMSPERQETALLVGAKNHIRKTGIKIS